MEERAVSEPCILRFEEIPSVSRGGGIVTKALAGAHVGTGAFTSGVTTFPPGAAIKFHTHNAEEVIVILEGDAQCDVAEESYPMKPLDTACIPAGIAHRFVNTGEGTMRILWTYGSTHVTRTFVDTGETVEHLSAGDTIGGR